MRGYVDDAVSVQQMRRHVDELVGQSAPFDMPPWDFAAPFPLRRLRESPMLEEHHYRPIPLEYSTIPIREDTFDSPRLQYRSNRPHPPFSTTILQKRKDLDEDAYSMWLVSDERFIDLLGYVHVHGLRPFWGDYRLGGSYARS
ncbi:hypothetical protein OROMI_013069 [Orobanche minor]